MDLDDFAYFAEAGWLANLGRMAMPENWGRDNRYLRVYCEANLSIAVNEGLLYQDPNGRFVVWRVGHLVTTDGLPIYMYFVKNVIENRQPWFYVGTLAARRLVIKYRPYGGGEEERILIDNPPRAPDYRYPEYHPEYKIEYQWAHFLEEHESRMKQYLPEIVNPRTLYVAIFGATELSHRLQRHAVPQYYRGRYQWLLPLYITRSDLSRPDLVAALEEDSDRGVYVARTLLPPEAAYGHARAVALSTRDIGSWAEPG